jgi:pyruvate-ferredoxin/flavodoxin oxidoreductase
MRREIVPIFELRGSELKPSDLMNICSVLGPETFGSTKYEKRGIAVALPVWQADKCVQCNSCALGCAHAVIRPRILRKGSGLKTIPSRQFSGYDFRIDVSPYDCLGCNVCVVRCPTKALSLEPATDALFQSQERDHEAAAALPDIDALAAADTALHKRLKDRKFTVDGSQYFTPLLEYSGACGGCHETLYAKMLTQLFGPRLMIANATGCSIIWSASFPSLPWTRNSRGQGPSGGTSLFEDNAEYGLGIYTAFAHRREALRGLVVDALKRPDVPADFRKALEEWLAVYLDGDRSLTVSNRITDLFATLPAPDFLAPIKARTDLFVKPSVWIVGGDGWAHDIGFTGLDHVLATGADVKLLVYDNESYANTGFQMSKSTPRGAVVKFAAVGKEKPKKALSEMMLQYPSVYVANCAIGADAKQTIAAMKEAEAHQGSAFLNCYCPCIGHGIKPSMEVGHAQARLAVESGYWPLFRRNPAANPKMLIDSKGWKEDALKKMLSNEVRYESLARMDRDRFEKLHSLLTEDVASRWAALQSFARQ